jgi:predicted  nucleic acid-binding Zn-ribbon protein
MSQAIQLMNLQKLDTKIQETKNRLQEIDDALNNNQTIVAARDALQVAEAELKPIKTRAKDVELELETTITKAKATEKRLYSGKVKNTKELEDMQMEIASLKSRQERLEETALELMLEVETAEHTLNECEEQLDSAQKRFASQSQAMSTEQTTREAELSNLKQQREAVRAEISPDHLQTYDRLQRRVRGAVVAKMNMDATCSICGVQQTRTTETEIRRGNVAQCSNCQRVLVF